MKWTQVMDLNNCNHFKFADGAFESELNKVVPFCFDYGEKQIGTAKLIKEDKGKLTFELESNNKEFILKVRKLVFDLHGDFVSIDYGKKGKLIEVIPISVAGKKIKEVEGLK